VVPLFLDEIGVQLLNRLPGEVWILVTPADELAAGHPEMITQQVQGLSARGWCRRSYSSREKV
jgi:hypothetical protein